MNVRFNELPPLSLPHSLPSTLFISKSIELLTGSGEVLVCYIQQWYHHFESGRAGDKFASGASKKIFRAKNLLTDTMLKVHIWAPSPL